MWIKYSERQPTEKGLYLWQKDTLLFSGKMRIRGAGLRNVLSPDFDYWDGYQVTVPDVEWWSFPIKNKVLKFTDRRFKRCPFCGRVPKLSGYQYSPHGGIVVCAEPFNYNLFTLKCCQMISIPSRSLDGLEKMWNRRA